ncbi:MAG: DUF2478 domain-containing protein [Paracoccus sp. (in: a-proteobacteria)]|nr:DUF2478 domain-containing protein [Paracoccus sp. (in: a-proteobacteria)]
MLGWIDHRDTGGGDGAHALMRDLAEDLAQAGICVRGAIQANQPGPDGCRCAMVLDILGDDGPGIVISQDLGPGARGCRLDGEALENAALRVIETMDGAGLVMVNKFGKQETFGRGMIPVIVTALSRGVPVLVSVAPEQLAEFTLFAGDMAEQLTPAAATDWCLRMAQRPALA